MTKKKTSQLLKNEKLKLLNYLFNKLELKSKLNKNKNDRGADGFTTLR